MVPPVQKWQRIYGIYSGLSKCPKAPYCGRKKLYFFNGEEEFRNSGIPMIRERQDEVMDAIRKELAFQLRGGNAHVPFDKAVAGLPAEKRGVAPPGMPYSAWQLLEHIRIAQADMLEFCTNPKYKAHHWPEDYWPKSPEPPDAKAWDRSVKQVKADLEAFIKLILDAKRDLNAKIPWGDGQTLFHEACLILDHNSYHLGELVAVRRALGAWE
jgi:hypothetical protein